MTKRWTPLVLLGVAGCAYFNGVYNAKSAARAADNQWERGEEFAAAEDFRRSAATAETVLVRHPRSRWRNQALYLAGRGFALARECGRGLIRLEQYLALPDEPADRRERAQVAQASCLFENRQLFEADSMLGQLLTSTHAAVRVEAALWGGRVALALGDADRAARLLGGVPGSAAAWEFMSAAFQQRNYATAESLLVTRAEAGDWRSEVPARVRALWSAGRREGAVRAVDTYGRSGAPTNSRVELHFMASDMAALAGDTALARRQAEEAGRVGVTAAIEADVRARLLALRIRELEVLADVEAAVSRDSVRARGSPLLRRIQDNLLLVRLSLSRPTDHGAHVFVAAEVVRDSLRAPRLAHDMFRSVERDYPQYEIAARALLAAARLRPDSAQAYQARIREQWPNSYARAWLDGDDPSLSTINAEDGALRQSWRFVTTQFDDTLKARRSADSVARASAQGGRGGGPP